MQTRTLGGEGGRRGFFGGSHSRIRVIGLIAVGIGGALATISFQAPGLFLGVAAAGVVFLATIRTHRGSLLTRVQARRRWRERVRLGTVDFVPVGRRPHQLETTGTGRKARAATRRAWNSYRDWPDGAEGMYWLQRGRGEPGIAWHAPTGEDAYLSVAFSVDGQIRGIEGDQFMESAMLAWGNLLARYGSPSQLPSRVQSVTRVVPVDSAYHEAWVVGNMAEDALDELTASYAEVVQRVSRSGLMQRHYVVVRWPITAQFLSAAARRGPAQEGWRTLMRAEISAVTSHLRTAKLGTVAALSAAQLAAVLRHMQTPSWPIDQAGDVSVVAPWVASHDEEAATLTIGPGPDGREEQWWHRTALIPIDAVETGPRTSMWLTPLLSRMPHPIVRTLSLQIEVIPARDARQSARTDVTTDLADLEAQREKGILTSEELAVALQAARSRLDDLRPGSGHHGAGWVGHVTISAQSREALIDATAKITEAASNAGISALDWLDTQQAAAAASTWPIARGMRPLQQTASTRLRSVLAGSGREGDLGAPAAAVSPAPAEPVEVVGRNRRARRAQRRERDLLPAPGVLELPEMRGYHLRRSGRKARRGWYAPQALGNLTSTRQAEILLTALVAAPTGAYGTLIGRDKLSNTPVAHDPFTAYEAGVISSPAVVVLGVIGAGKSSLLKTVYVMRPLVMRARRVVVMDRKDRGGEGEYAELTRRLRSEPLRFVIGDGGTVLNVLDPTILAGDGIAGQARLLIALAELANDGGELDKWEKASLRAAHRATLRAAEAKDEVPVLEHLMHHLGQVTEALRTHGEAIETAAPLPDFGDYSRASLERMHQAGLGVRHLLSALLSDELAGMFDGPTSARVQLSHRLTTFDISQLPDDGPATSMVMAVANVWLLGTLRHRRGLRTNFVAEEGWDLVGGPGGRVFMRNSKLARGLGLSNIAALHHIADIPPHDPAIAMLKEAQTVHLYRQDRDDDIEATMRLYGLGRGSRTILGNLADGHHLLNIGNRREIHVEHIRSRLERGLTNTDEAMVTSGPGRRL